MPNFVNRSVSKEKLNKFGIIVKRESVKCKMHNILIKEVRFALNN
jgi:hypothetical protein